MTALTISRSATAAMQVAQFIRNGKAPTADVQNQLSTMVGYAAKVLAKPVFHSPGELVGTGGASLVLDSLATRPRWRFAFHTSPYHWYLMARFEIAPQNNGSATSPYCKLEISDTSRTLVGLANVYGGSSDGSYADVPINMTGGTALVLNPAELFEVAALSPDAEYTGAFWDVGYARLHSASVWEVTLEPDTDNGYAANNHASGSPIYAQQRDDVAAMARLLHKRSGVSVFHWCSNVDSAAPSQASGASTGAASLTLGALTLSAAGTVGGTGVADMTLGAMTVAATATVAEFDAVVSTTAVDGHLYSVPVDVTLSATASGIAQTNGSIAVIVYDNYSPSTFIDSITTTDLDGWSELGWTEFFGVWRNTYTRTSVSVGTDEITFQMTFHNNGYVFVATTGTAPTTDQAHGDGNSFALHLGHP